MSPDQSPFLHISLQFLTVNSKNTYPAVAMEVVVNYSEAFPGVVAPVSPAHQVLDNQTHINQSYFIIWRQVTL